jgi:phosphatidylinositol phospholipase C, delta
VLAQSRVTSEHCCIAVAVSNVSLLPVIFISQFILVIAVDIYDGDREPVIFHGKTLTTKVALREVCHAIAKYAFVASPYPVIISAEIHCSLPQQDMMVDIMKEVFGDSLICAPIDGQRKIEILPSPEDLKQKILLKV